jgi:hypothetical protein
MDFTKIEAAAYCHLNPSTLQTYHKLQIGPPHCRVGTRSVYKQEDLDAWMLATGRSDIDPVTLLPRTGLVRKDAAKYLGVSPQTLACYVSARKGPKYHKHGIFCVYEKSDLDAWRAANPIVPKPTKPAAVIAAQEKFAKPTHSVRLSAAQQRREERFLVGMTMEAVGDTADG